MPLVLKTFNGLLYTSQIIPITTNTPNILDNVIIKSWYWVKINIAKAIVKIPNSWITIFKNRLLANFPANWIKSIAKQTDT